MSTSRRSLVLAPSSQPVVEHAAAARMIWPDARGDRPGYGLPVRARSGQDRARLIVAVLLGAGALIACHPQPSETPEPATNVAWMPGQTDDGDAGEEPEDDGSHEIMCNHDPEAPGCPWDRNAINTAPEGVWGNSNPHTMPLPVARPQRCPESAVMSGMISIPAGEFVMGCDSLDSKACGKAERTRVVVDLPAFSIDRTEVTQAAYARCIEADVCTPPAGGFEPTDACTHPVVNVSWEQAGQYCAWQNQRLPTEAEWEKAARGTDERMFPWGDEAPTCELANFAGCGLREAQPVASHPSGASPYGVMDLAGNVREWVFDREESRTRQPKRGIRGGMFTDQGMQLRAARRQWGDVSVSDLGIGFRCAR
jgi:formylglycine-generating enzyme required for sulfatase activity